jgi:hypothetical protein
MRSSTAANIGISFRLNIDLPQDHAATVIKRGQQMSARTVRGARAAQCLAIHRDHPPHASRRGRAMLRPAAGRVI